MDNDNGNTPSPRMQDTLTVIAAVKSRPDVAPFASIVGRWVWVTFPSKPSADTRDYLKAQGFVWNRKREAWQHCGGVPSHHSPGDPRFRYGEVPVEEVAQGAS